LNNHLQLFVRDSLFLVQQVYSGLRIGFVSDACTVTIISRRRAGIQIHSQKVSARIIGATARAQEARRSTVTHVYACKMSRHTGVTYCQLI